jgi:hypothetical protein
MSTQDEYEVVIFDFSPTGAIAVKTEGFEGQSCIDAVKDIEEDLGEVTHVVHTEEFHRKPQREVQQKDVARRTQ